MKSGHAMTSDMTSMLRLLVVTLAMLATGLMIAGPASAQDPCLAAQLAPEYPVGRGKVLVGATVTTPGATITIQGDDWDCETIVEIVIVDNSGNRQSVGTVTTDRDGNFDTAIVVPADVVGSVKVEITGKDLTGAPRQDVVDLAVDTTAAPMLQSTLLPVQGTSPVLIGAGILAALLLLSGAVAFRRTRETI